MGNPNPAPPDVGFLPAGTATPGTDPSGAVTGEGLDFSEPTIADYSASDQAVVLAFKAGSAAEAAEVAAFRGDLVTANSLLQAAKGYASQIGSDTDDDVDQYNRANLIITSAQNYINQVAPNATAAAAAAVTSDQGINAATAAESQSSIATANGSKGLEANQAALVAKGWSPIMAFFLGEAQVIGADTETAINTIPVVGPKIQQFLNSTTILGAVAPGATTAGSGINSSGAGPNQPGGSNSNTTTSSGPSTGVLIGLGILAVIAVSVAVVVVAVRV